MSLSDNDGGPAFPCAELVNSETGEHLANAAHGMSLRDYFAAAALSLTTAACDAACDASEESTCDGAAHARQAYAIADAMLTERGRK